MGCLFKKEKGKGGATDPFVAEKIKAGVPIDHGWAWMCVVSPFSNSFAVRFSSRAVVMTGGLLVTVAFLLSSFAASLTFLYFSYGMLAGIGFGLVYAPSITVVGYYFHERRALANGLSVSGSSIGSFFMPVLTAYLIDEFSIKGAFIILAGFNLNLCICAALLRPMEFYVERTKRWLAESSPANNTSERRSSFGDLSEDVGKFKVIPVSIVRLDSLHEASEGEEDEGPAAAMSIASSDHNFKFKGIMDSQRWQSMSILQINSQADTGTGTGTGDPGRTRSCAAIVMSLGGARSESLDASGSLGGEPGLERRVSESDIGSTQNTLDVRTVPIFSESALQAVRKELVRMEQNKVLKRSRPQSYFFKRLLSPRLHQAREMLGRGGGGGGGSIVASVPDLTFASLQNLPQGLSAGPPTRRPAGFCAALRAFCKIRQKVAVPGKVAKGRGVPILDPWVLRQPSFYLLSVAMACGIMVFASNFTLIPSHMATKMGVPRIQGAKVLQFFGITDLCGRLFVGWFADYNLIPRKYLLAFFLMCEGLISVLVPFVFTSYSAMIAYALLMGLFGGMISPLTAVVICDTIGIRRLSSAYGLTMLIFGGVAVTVPPILGYIRDVTGSWDGAFCLNGGLCGFCALLCILEVVVVSRRWPIKKEEEEEKEVFADMNSKSTPKENESLI